MVRTGRLLLSRRKNENKVRQIGSVPGHPTRLPSPAMGHRVGKDLREATCPVRLYRELAAAHAQFFGELDGFLRRREV
jgi:hypothetical protein